MSNAQFINKTGKINREYHELVVLMRDHLIKCEDMECHVLELAENFKEIIK